MDLGLILGFVGTWLLIVWALIAGGETQAYIDIPSIILVGGATITVVMFCFPLATVKKIFGVAKRAAFAKPQDPQKLIEDLVSYAEIARRDGILSLENVTKDIDDEFIVHGIQMAVDGVDPELIQTIMESDLENLVERHDSGKALFDAVGRYAPAFGMIGTLVGLVIMLKNMDDPAKIGPGMAIALLTTLYGALIANAFALPLVDRLSRRSAEEVLAKTIIIRGVMAIQSGDNPRIVERKLRTFLPPGMRRSGEEEKQAA